MTPWSVWMGVPAGKQMLEMGIGMGVGEGIGEGIGVGEGVGEGEGVGVDELYLYT